MVGGAAPMALNAVGRERRWRGDFFTGVGIDLVPVSFKEEMKTRGRVRLRSVWREVMARLAFMMDKMMANMLWYRCNMMSKVLWYSGRGAIYSSPVP